MVPDTVTESTLSNADNFLASIKQIRFFNKMTHYFCSPLEVSMSKLNE